MTSEASSKTAGSKAKEEDAIICGGCGATYPFEPLSAIRHWEAWGTDEKHQAFNCLVVNGPIAYHVRMTIEGERP